MGAHLVALRRTRSGVAELAWPTRLDDLTPESLAAALVPMMAVLETWPSVIAGESEAADLRLGRAVNRRRRATPFPAGFGSATGRDWLVALAASDGSRVQPFCVF